MKLTDRFTDELKKEIQIFLKRKTEELNNFGVSNILCESFSLFSTDHHEKPCIRFVIHVIDKSIFFVIEPMGLNHRGTIYKESVYYDEENDSIEEVLEDVNKAVEKLLRKLGIEFLYIQTKYDLGKYI